jgi:hypothetical protein
MQRESGRAVHSTCDCPSQDIESGRRIEICALHEVLVRLSRRETLERLGRQCRPVGECE